MYIVYIDSYFDDRLQSSLLSNRLSLSVKGTVPLLLGLGSPCMTEERGIIRITDFLEITMHVTFSKQISISKMYNGGGCTKYETCANLHRFHTFCISCTEA